MDKKTFSVDILGTRYSVTVCHRDEDPALAECDGYCSVHGKRIVVDDLTAYAEEKPALSETERDTAVRKNLRHEILHAFLAESGLGNNWTHPQYGHDETAVDWIALQFPKLLTAYQEAGALPDGWRVIVDLPVGLAEDTDEEDGHGDEKEGDLNHG